MTRVSLTLSEDQHAHLRAHLFPGDGLEAVAFLACGRAAGEDRHRLVVRTLQLIPHDACRRERDRISWNAESIVMLLDRAEVEGLSLIKVHSHPQGFPTFSTVDDESDAQLLPTIRSWVEADVPHGSVVMLPDGAMFGRYLWRGDEMNALDHINVAGPDIRFWWNEDEHSEADPAFAASQDQAFGEGTTRRLGKMKFGIVGASGSGSPTIEQLVRLGAGHVVIVDDDHVEDRNLNRITFATADDAKARRMKVHAAAQDIARKDLGTVVTAIDKEVTHAEALRALSTCDVIFGCVDSKGGRFYTNLLATHYLIPYFDIGILLDAEQNGSDRGRIKDIMGTIHYMVPGRSSLVSRGVITLQDVAAEALHKRDPIAAKQQVEDKYIKGMQVRRPAVISVNFFASSLAVNDFIARLHPFRKADNVEVASIEFSLGEMRLTLDEELDDCLAMKRYVGVGDSKFWLGVPELGAP